MGKGLAKDSTLHAHDGELVCDEYSFMSGCLSTGGVDGIHHAGGNINVVFAPTGKRGVPHERPTDRVNELGAPRVNSEAFESIPRLDEAVVEGDIDAGGFGNWASGFLCTLQGGGPEEHNIVVGERLGGGDSHGLAASREMIVGNATIEDAIRVIDLAMADEMDDGVRHDGWVTFRFPLVVTVWACGGEMLSHSL